ncbi:hypothetical protein [Neisseria shayeganii]|uniref:Uncharacterized protein n=1 Tax=Neisseria shayeganii TaxID=607712 RepID=A0A7D7S8Y3_9NEIS|nr:hypothetical protein [Neisseria shayeganii]QMT41248.1 hypothetical protein H3L94_04260 [Neisseria shayeganii]
MNYYLMYPDSAKIVVRGNPRDTLSYERFDKTEKVWKSDINLWWKLETSDFIDFNEIDEAEALRLISRI